MRVLRHAVVRDGVLADKLFAATAVEGRHAYWEAACEAGLLRPDEISEGLLSIPPQRFPILTPRALAALGHAAAQHASVRDRLLASWVEFRAHDGSTRMQFPGRALEALVVAGDDQAIEVYADWLPNSFNVSGMYGGPPPDPLVFERAAILASARSITRAVWDQAENGRVGADGTRTHLAWGSAGSVLVQLAPAWEDSVEIVATLFAWLESADASRRLAALTPLAKVTLTEQQRVAVLSAVRRCLTDATPIVQFFEASRAVALAEAHGLVPGLLTELRELVELGAPCAVAAACAAAPFVPEDEAILLSRFAADRDFDAMEFDGIDRDALTHLVNLAADDWRDGVLRHAANRGMLNLGLVAPVLRVLPRPHQRQIVESLREAVRPCVIPWCAHRLDDDIYRPVDLVERLAFESGIE
jgi:hypothetical protein